MNYPMSTVLNMHNQATGRLPALRYKTPDAVVIDISESLCLSFLTGGLLYETTHHQ